MSTYRKTWDCCGDTTETESWEPEQCPFCEVQDLANHHAELVEALADAIEALEVSGEWLAAKTSQEILDRVRNGTP